MLGLVDKRIPVAETISAEGGDEAAPAAAEPEAEVRAHSVLRVAQHRSRNGSNKRQLGTLRSLGLRRIGQTVEVEDTPQARGMLHAVRHLVSVDSQAPK